MLPAVNAGLVPQEETVDFSLDAVTAYDSLWALMMLRSAGRPADSIALTITYDTNQVMMTGFLYHGGEPAGEEAISSFLSIPTALTARP